MRTNLKLMGVIILAITLGTCLWLSQSEPTLAFQSEIWKSDERGIRIQMIDDLFKNYPLLGKSKAEINQLLGIPPRTNYFKDFDYVFWLGPQRGFISIDSEWLCLRFKDDKVQEVRILSD